jgi:hypothetical protein
MINNNKNDSKAYPASLTRINVCPNPYEVNGILIHGKVTAFHMLSSPKITSNLRRVEAGPTKKLHSLIMLL